MRLNSFKRTEEERTILTNEFRQAKEIVLEEERKRKESENSRKVKLSIED